MCKEITASSALNKLKRKIPYGWDLNIYRGCSHGCRYCYAIYSHGYMQKGSEDGFFSDIYVKKNIVDLLEKELKAESWQREVINIGGITDSYQPAEKKHKLMPEILKLMISYKTPAIISTKSDLVLRDYDLIDQLSRITYINIAATITTADEELRKKIEPHSSPSAARFAVLKEFRKTNASIGMHMMPIIPLLADSSENFEKLFSEAADCGVDYLLPGVLYLRGKTRQAFFTFLEEEFPKEALRYRTLYRRGGADKEYKNRLYQVVNALRDKYNLSGSYMKPMLEKLQQ